MSRYKINSDKYLVYVGYKKTLRTFFAIVKKEDEEVLCVGTDYDEISSVSQLAFLIAQYASIPYKTIVKLEEDSREYFEPSYLQSFAEHFAVTHNC